MQEIKNEIENTKISINSQEINKDQEEKIKSEIAVQEQYKQILLTQKVEKTKQLSQISSKTEEIYLEVYIFLINNLYKILQFLKNDMKLRELNEIIKKHPDIYSKFSSNIKEPNYQKLKDTNHLLEEITKNTTKNILKELYPSNFKHVISPQINEMIKKSTENKDKMQETIKSLQNEIEKVKFYISLQKIKENKV